MIVILIIILIGIRMTISGPLIEWCTPTFSKIPQAGVQTHLQMADNTACSCSMLRATTDLPMP
jgi:hypothetical protein